MFISSFTDALRVVVSTILIYDFLILVLRISGKHVISQFSAIQFAVAISVGNLLATTILDKPAGLCA